MSAPPLEISSYHPRDVLEAPTYSVSLCQKRPADGRTDGDADADADEFEIEFEMRGNFVYQRHGARKNAGNLWDFNGRRDWSGFF